jgi:hypothetical protein
VISMFNAASQGDRGDARPFCCGFDLCAFPLLRQKGINNP